MNEYETLCALKNAISEVDNFCPECIRNFIETANIDLEKAQSKFRYKYDIDADDDEISVEEVN